MRHINLVKDNSVEEKVLEQNMQFVAIIDRIKYLLDSPEKLSVILHSYDWQGASDRLDPTKVTIKCINIEIRRSVVKILIDFLNERKTEVKMNKKNILIIRPNWGRATGESYWSSPVHNWK